MLFNDDVMTSKNKCLHFVKNDKVKLEYNELKEKVMVFEVDVSKVSSKQDFFHLLCREMNFPDYFGMNWDALDDCLSDLSWLDGNGYVLCLKGADHFWQNSFSTAGTFVELWLSSAEFWHKKGVSFHLVFLY